jgi:DNA-binding transcriptional MerR regulator
MVWVLKDNEEYALRVLAEKTDTSPRTIRYYISKELLPPPIRHGRDAAYNKSHVERLEAIQEYKKEGYTLNEIRAILASGGSEGQLPESVTWHRYRVSEYVEVNVRSDAPPWRVRGILKQMQRIEEYESEE